MIVPIDNATIFYLVFNMAQEVDLYLGPRISVNPEANIKKCTVCTVAKIFVNLRQHFYNRLFSHLSFIPLCWQSGNGEVRKIYSKNALKTRQSRLSFRFSAISRVHKTIKVKIIINVAIVMEPDSSCDQKNRC